MDTIFFITGKIAWVFLSPEIWPVIALALALVGLWRGNIRRARRWIIITVLFLLIASFAPIANLILHPLEARFEQPKLTHVDGIIILGGVEEVELTAIWDQPVLNNRSERILAGLALAHAYPDAKLVFAGDSETLMRASPVQGLTTQIMAMADLSDARFIREDQSRSTYENATLSKALVNPGADETWVLVTSAWHMPRSVGVFCKAGWSVTPYPVDYRSGLNPRPTVRLGRHLSELGLAGKEWLGLVAYWASGKTDRLLPKGCQ